MERETNSAIHSEDCDKEDEMRINKEHFKDGEILQESQKLNLQPNENHFEDSVWSNNLECKTGTKQETWDPHVTSDIKSEPPNSDLSTNTIKHDVEINVKEEYFYQVEISTELQKLHLLQSGTHFVECAGSSDMDIKIRIKQESVDPNVVSSDIKSNSQNPSTFLGTGAIKDDEEPWWCNRTSIDSHSEQQEGELHKQEASKDMLLLESTRLPKDGIYANSIEVEKGDDSYKTAYGVSGSQGSSMRQNLSNLASDIQYLESQQSLGDENTLTHNCKTSENYSISESSFNPHIVLQSGKKLYKCERCEKCFADKSNLRKHLQRHSGTKPFKCDICEKCFVEKANLVRHMFLHSGTKQFKCDTCQKCFTWKSDLKRHSLLHSGKKPHKCDKCEKCYAQKSTLHSHKFLHSGTKPYKCDECGKCYTHKSNLQGHKLLHASISPYKCAICDKSFIWKSHLQRHSLLHSGAKPHKCNKCEAYFTDKSNLRQHVLTHSGTKPYMCVKCEKCFTKKSGLKRHIVLQSCKKS